MDFGTELDSSLHIALEPPESTKEEWELFKKSNPYKDIWAFLRATEDLVNLNLRRPDIAADTLARWHGENVMLGRIITQLEQLEEDALSNREETIEDE